MRDLVGKTLDQYNLIALLGTDRLGAVFKSNDLNTDRYVAIKVMHPHLSKQTDFQVRLLQEARTAFKLHHPSIVSVYDIGQAQSMLYIVMEFIPGDNLYKLLSELRVQEKWIPLSEAVQLIVHVASATDYAHKNGVLHRDLKPANIILKPLPSEDLPYRPVLIEGLPYLPVLTDLGLARLMEMPSISTLPYMSPEQTIGNPKDARSDVYSLGILLFELAVGRLPFPIKSISDAIIYHSQEPLHSLRAFHPEIPEALESIILKTLNKDPDQRIQNPYALAEAIQAISRWSV